MFDDRCSYPAQVVIPELSSIHAPVAENLYLSGSAGVPVSLDITH